MSDRPGRGPRKRHRNEASAPSGRPRRSRDGAGARSLLDVAPANTTRGAVLDALAILRDESPETYRLVSARLAAAPSDVTVGEERLGVTSSGGIVRVRDAPPDAPLLVATIDRAGVVQLIDGTITIEQLLEAHRLHVRGHPDALLGFLSAARAFADAAIRSSALQRGFERYRGDGSRRQRSTAG